MPSILLSDNGVSSGSAGLKSTAASDGALALQTTTAGGTATTAVTIDTSQLVGLGTTPAAKLHLLTTGNTTADGVRLTFGSEARSHNIYSALPTGRDLTIAPYRALTINTGSGTNEGVLTLNAYEYTVFGTGSSYTERMRLDASGNLGVGTTSPYIPSGSTQRTIEASSTGLVGSFYATANQISTVRALLAANSFDSTTYTGSVTNHPFLFLINNSERARIDTSGNLGIGTASAYATVSLYVGTATNGATSGGGIGLLGGGGANIDIGHASGTASGSFYNRYIYNGSVIGSISQNGTTGVLFNITSDYRLKNNPTPVTGAKEFVMALQPKTWDWWDGSGKGVGFIAHEFMEVAKHSGHGEKDAVDEEGNIIPQSIQPSSSEVMANLVAHIQELETRLAALENK